MIISKVLIINKNISPLPKSNSLNPNLSSQSPRNYTEPKKKMLSPSKTNPNK